MKRLPALLLAWALLFPLLGARAEVLPLTNLSSGYEAFVYVPRGERYREAQLEVSTRSDQSGRLRLYLDGSYRSVTALPADGRVQLPVGTLGEGFHRLRLEPLLPQPLGGQADHNLCLEIRQAAFSARAAQLNYTPQRTRAPRLSDLPDPLYDRTRTVAVLAGVSAPEGSAVNTALLRLAQALGGDRPVIWQRAEAAENDFELRLERSEEAGNRAELEVTPGVLRIRFTSDASLGWAVNALSDPDYRSLLRRSRVILSREVPQPPAATLRVPLSLEDYGLTDLSLRSGEQRTLALALPAAFTATGRASGTLVTVSATGLASGSRLWAWVADEPVIAHDLADRDGTVNREKLNFSGSRSPAASGTSLRLQADLLGNDACTPLPTGQLFVDARASRVDIGARTKSGVGALASELLGNPRVTLPAGVPEARAFAMTVASNLYAAGLRGVLPLEATAAGGSLTLAQETVRAAQLPDVALEGGALLRAHSGGVTVTAANTAAWSALSRAWPSAQARLEDRVTAALISADRQVTVLERDRASSESPESPAPWGWVVAAIGAFLIGSVLLMMLGSRKRRS
ncbi:hypothetical protein HNR42_003619 [Deinobacterium chartae]|uniref:Cellulose synthase subunit n=1 Tax=Deinobacterium chartae TaxID=521158 RepID=A0A841I7F9_9DEIO|nr:hypothetical protein [Deinobacterium chartae]MBB6100149.1 hypothetical protein [Deinobacterium chartae]